MSLSLSESRLRLAATGLVVIAALFLHLYNLHNYPIPWYDEGSHLHVAKNIALHGVYADSSSEGYRPFGPAVGVGPTVMLPIAALFSVFGVSIPLARLVIVVYSLLTLLLVYIIALRFVRWPFALMAVVLLLLVPTIRYLYYSRTVVGEAPGMFFFLAGLALWLHPRGRSTLGLVCVGVLIGLATITKNQYAFFILPGLFLNWMADIFWYKQRGWRYFVIPGVISGLIFAGWLYIVIIKLGEGGDFAENLRTLQTAGTGALIVVDKYSIQRVAKLLAGEGTYGALFIPALLYSVVVSLRRSEVWQDRGIIAMFLVVSTLLFSVSLGWDRYAFGPVVIVVIFLVMLIRDLADIVISDNVGIIQSIRQAKPSPALLISLLLIGWLIISVGFPFYNRFQEVRTQGLDDAYVAADWIKTNIPNGALIETWEQEIGVLTDNTLHYPPQLILAYSVAAQWQGGEPVSDYYDFREPFPPEYVVRGPFGAFTELYPDDRLTDYEIIQVIGPYQVFQRRSEVNQ
jgi:4-amino-4-deoxy-L-arabinose transferase-like glycosyltransferase